MKENFQLILPCKYKSPNSGGQSNQRSRPGKPTAIQVIHASIDKLEAPAVAMHCARHHTTESISLSTSSRNAYSKAGPTMVRQGIVKHGLEGDSSVALQTTSVNVTDQSAQYSRPCKVHAAFGSAAAPMPERTKRTRGTSGGTSKMWTTSLALWGLICEKAESTIHNGIAVPRAVTTYAVTSSCFIVWHTRHVALHTAQHLHRFVGEGQQWASEAAARAARA
mmetsp:Transcript_16864/g.44402  ORF Transcript_16864/g.44402 Transcript_16864/m.44402 type:complete len:222 (-) Transcript_16864:2-667(-)